MLQSPFVSSSDGKFRRWVGGAATALVLLGVGAGYGVWRWQLAQKGMSQAAVIRSTEITTVTALGRLEPQGEVIQLSAPTSSNGNRVEQLLVQEGDRVNVGQVIAILDSRDRLQAAYEQAVDEVRVAEAQLAITEAGAKQGEINAQRAEIDRLKAQHQGDMDAEAATVARLTSELQNAATEWNRYQSLYQEGVISASDLDRKRLILDTARRSLEEAKAVLARIQTTSPAQLHQAQATLRRIMEVRPVDIRAHQAEVERAKAAMKQARAALDQAYVRSPMAGEILEIHTRPGEIVANDGIVEMGQTLQMQAIAEVYQSDVGKVHPGQRVRVTSDTIPGALTGTVERVNSLVRRQTMVNTDPSANIDARVVEVHVRLDDASNQKAAKFTNLQVQVVIEQ
ncbi:ABC transporter permease [Neosynechococcus sphagnicola sy1]|uniref:ABC transporter permease n=1 Tax=Neosynechococcus sphagnicola sy1 TaxID=1497020 RepID=A0A098TSJ5_9CYAN|nr:ABC exporter membrane fusion protein [Neosynechococcus sphagnicola]KGF73748.1 ABC transporter permease [Neosynechococcus sphagnicola sy1]